MSSANATDSAVLVGVFSISSAVFWMNLKAAAASRRR
jgi:hypothetical protein